MGGFGKFHLLKISGMFYFNYEKIIWEPPINRRNYKYMVLHIMNREIEKDAGNAKIACSWLSK